MVGRQVRVGDAPLDREAVSARGDTAYDLAVDADRLVAERDGPRVGEDEAAQALAGTGVAGAEEGVAPDEVALVEADGEAEPGLERGLVRRDVARPDPVALLQSQRVDRAIAAGDEAVRLARLPQRVPEGEAVLDTRAS